MQESKPVGEMLVLLRHCLQRRVALEQQDRDLADDLRDANTILGLLLLAKSKLHRPFIATAAATTATVTITIAEQEDIHLGALANYRVSVQCDDVTTQLTVAGHGGAEHRVELDQQMSQRLIDGLIHGESVSITVELVVNLPQQKQKQKQKQKQQPHQQQQQQQTNGSIKVWSESVVFDSLCFIAPVPTGFDDATELARLISSNASEPASVLTNHRTAVQITCSSSSSSTRDNGDAICSQILILLLAYSLQSESALQKIMSTSRSARFVVPWVSYPVHVDVHLLRQSPLNASLQARLLVTSLSAQATRLVSAALSSRIKRLLCEQTDGKESAPVPVVSKDARLIQFEEPLFL